MIPKRRKKTKKEYRTNKVVAINESSHSWTSKMLLVPYHSSLVTTAILMLVSPLSPGPFPPAHLTKYICFGQSISRFVLSPFAFLSSFFSLSILNPSPAVRLSHD